MLCDKGSSSSEDGDLRADSPLDKKSETEGAILLDENALLASYIHSIVRCSTTGSQVTLRLGRVDALYSKSVLVSCVEIQTPGT